MLYFDVHSRKMSVKGLCIDYFPKKPLKSQVYNTRRNFWTQFIRLYNDSAVFKNDKNTTYSH